MRIRSYYDNEPSKLPYIIGAIVAIILLIWALYAAEPSNFEYIDAIEKYGFHDVELTEETGLFSCGGFSTSDIHYYSFFNATNSSGEKVHGIVCCGTAKMCSVKF
jgi:hypothetical protein